MNNHFFNDNKKTEEQMSVDITIDFQKTCNESFYDVQIPFFENSVNKPLSFSTRDPEKIVLMFQIYRRFSGQKEDIQVLNAATAFLKSLQGGFAPKRESLIRHYMIFIVQQSTMACISSVTFSVLSITSFDDKSLVLKASFGFWKRNGFYSIVEHRGSGANSD